MLRFKTNNAYKNLITKIEPPVDPWQLPPLLHQPSSSLLAEITKGRNVFGKAFHGIYLTVHEPHEGIIGELYFIDGGFEWELIGPFEGDPSEGRPEYRLYLKEALGGLGCLNPLDRGFNIGVLSSSDLFDFTKRIRQGRANTNEVYLYNRWKLELYPHYKSDIL